MTKFGFWEIKKNVVHRWKSKNILAFKAVNNLNQLDRPWQWNMLLYFPSTKSNFSVSCYSYDIICKIAKEFAETFLFKELILFFWTASYHHWAFCLPSHFVLKLSRQSKEVVKSCLQINSVSEKIFFYKFILFYLFIFGCVGSSLLPAGFSLVATSGDYSSLRCTGFSLQWLLLLQSTGSRHVGFSSCGTRAQ